MKMVRPGQLPAGVPENCTPPSVIHSFEAHQVHIREEQGLAEDEGMDDDDEDICARRTAAEAARYLGYKLSVRLQPPVSFHLFGDPALITCYKQFIVMKI